MGFKAIQTIVGYSDANVNMKNTGATLIFTNPNANGLYFPTKVRIYGLNLSGITAAPTFSVGTNSTSYNNILPATQATGLVNGGFIDYAIQFPGALLQVNNQVFVNVTIGANATNYGCRFALFMDYF